MNEMLYSRVATPEEWKEISRWLASEASVTTGNCGAEVPAPRPRCRDSGRKTRGFAATQLNPCLISMHPFGVPVRLSRPVCFTQFS